MIDNPKIDITPSCVLAMDLSSGYMNTTGTKKVFDHSQYHNHGTVVGTLPRYPGFFFDGTDDYINVGNHSSLNITDAITIEAWVKGAVDGADQLVYAGIAGSKSYKLGMSVSGGTFNFRVYTDVAGEQVNSTTIMEQDIWYHVVGVYTGSKIRIYVNGILEDEGDKAGSMIPFNNAYIGWQTGGLAGERYFNGAIDEVRIYNEVLIALEIKNHYELTRWKYGK